MTKTTPEKEMDSLVKATILGTKPGITEDDGFTRLVAWFDHWLADPITEREKVIIGETIDYLKKKEDVHGRYKI